METANTDKDHIHLLKDYCREVGSLFLAPRSSGEILTMNQHGKMVLQDTEEIQYGVKTKVLNHNSIVTTFRRGMYPNYTNDN